MGWFQQVCHFVDDDVFEEVLGFLDQFGVETDVAGTVVAASRLLKKLIIRAAKHWFFSTNLGTYNEEMPKPPIAILTRLAELRAQQERTRWTRIDRD